MKHKLSDLVKLYQTTNDERYFTQILERFSPLVRKYMKKLYYIEKEDSIQELNLALYEAVRNMSYVDNEYACISYLNKIIYHRFCKLYARSRSEQTKQEREIPYEDFNQDAEDSSSKTNYFSLISMHCWILWNIPKRTFFL